MSVEFRVSARGSRQIGVRLPPAAAPDPLLLERLRRPRPVPRPSQAPRESALPRWRHALVLAGIGLATIAFVPRALAYARLHEAGNSVANYGLCMAGPTGPATLLEHPKEFWRLVRRRIVAGTADSRPFEACASLLDGFGESAKRGVHTARAADFREYAPNVARTSAHSLHDLEVTSERFWELAREAWPFAPSDPAVLVTPSRTARAAVHPVPLPAPASGRGLPDMDVAHGTVRQTADGYLLVAGSGANQVAFVSRDAGKSWTSFVLPPSAARAGQCGAGEATSTFQLASEGDQLRLESWQSGEVQTSFPLAPAEARRVSISCDASAALALVIGETPAPAQLMLCPHGSRCRELAVPAEIQRLATAQSELSIARVRGTSVLSIAGGGIVRVISSRDDGETWTPPVVAYDAEEIAAARPGQGTGSHPESPSAIPTRLLALGERVLLYAGADAKNASYPVLASDDFGASWRGLDHGS